MLGPSGPDCARDVPGNHRLAMSPLPVSESAIGPFITSSMKPPQLHLREGLFPTLGSGNILHQVPMVRPA